MGWVYRAKAGRTCASAKLVRRFLGPSGLVFAALSSLHGNAAAQVAISESGTPSYSHTIAVPPGIAGMAPSIGLQYSAGGVNGPVGYGWSIQGISAIARCPNTKAVDGAVRGVDYTAADKLCLDGQRLIQTNATGALVAFPQTNDSLGGTGLVREFRTEKDTFARIRAYGTAGGAAANGPAYFKVWTKSGQIYEYGNNANTTANSAIAIQGKTAISSWAVSRISDTLGNYIDFQYTQRDPAWGTGPTVGAPVAGHEWNLAEIRYTGRPGQDPVNKVVFSYSDRATTAGAAQDRAEAFQKGSKNVSISRLDAIRTYTNWPASQTAMPGTVVRVKAVKLDYDNGPLSQRSRVVRIRDCQGDNEAVCLPSANFTYGAGGDESFARNTAFNLSTVKLLDVDFGRYGMLTGDFDGDGRTDILRWAHTKTENALYLSNGDGSFRQITNGSGAQQFNVATEQLFKGNGVWVQTGPNPSPPNPSTELAAEACFKTMVADFNGDGLSDIFIWSRSGVAFTGTQYRVDCPGSNQSKVYLSNGDGSFALQQIRTAGTNAAINLQILQPAQYACNTAIDGGLCTGDGYDFYFGDVNGDGRLDIMVAKVEARYVYNMNSTTCGGDCTWVLFGNGDGSFSVPYYPASLRKQAIYYQQTRGRKFVFDFNGDGLADVLVPGTTGSAYLSRGNGEFDVVGGIPSCTNPGTVMDANGDGRFDVLCAKPDVASNRVWVSKGDDGFMSVVPTGLNAAGQELTPPVGSTTGMSYALIDVNGDGRTDVIRWSDVVTNNKLFLSNGDGTFRASTPFNLNVAGRELSHSNGGTDFLIGDFTGRGSVEILRLKNNPSTVSEATANQIYTKANVAQPDQLIRVTSPTGLKTDLTWAPITNTSVVAGAARYKSDRAAGNPAVFPKVDLAMPAQVVVRTVTDSGVATQQLTTEYSYAGLKASYDGRGTQGFRETRRQAPGPDGSPLTVVTQYLQDFPYSGVASQTATFLGTLDALPSSPISRTQYTYCEKTAVAGAEAAASYTSPCPVPSATKVLRPYLFKSFEEGWELPANGGATLPTITTTNVFNGSGDATSVSVTTAGTALGLTQSATKVTANTYLADDVSGDNWVLGRLQRATQQSTVPNSLASITTSFGGAALANAVQGTRDALTVSVTPTSVSKTQTNANAFVSTASVAVAGSPTLPLNYTWARVAGATARISTSGTSSVTFSASLAANEAIAETFRVTVTDGAGRTGSADVPVTFSLTPPALGASASPNPAVSSRNNPGAASATTTVAITGGVSPFSTVWTRLTGSRVSVSGTTSASFSVTLGWGESLSESFRATVTDAVGQVKTVDVTASFTTPAQPAVSISPSPLSINRNNAGVASAAATASATGGVAPFTYAWTRTAGTRSSVSSATAAAPTFSATLGWGENFTETWQVTATDAAGNLVSSSVNVSFTTPTQPAVGISPNPLTIARNNPGAGAGTLTATPFSGVAPYTFSWSRTVGTRSSISSATVAAPSVSATLGWSESFTDTWKVTVTDAVGNTTNASVNVTFTTPAQPTVSISPSPAPLSRNNPGTATATLSAAAAGGVSPYTYAWVRTVGTRSTLSSSTIAAPSVSASLSWSESATETWQVSVTDAAGNVASAQVNVNFSTPAQPSVSVSPSSSTLSRNNPGVAAGVLTATAAGGVAPYSYSWVRTAGTRSTVSNSAIAGPTVSASLGWSEGFTDTWQVTVNDAAGNAVSANASVAFSTPAQPAVSISPSSLTLNASAPGTVSGTVTASASGGVAPFTYGWARTAGTRSSVSSSTIPAPSISATLGYGESFVETWQVTATDAAGNAVSSAVNATFTSPAAPAIVMSPTSFAFGSVKDLITVTATFAVTNSGGAGVFNVSLVNSNGGGYGLPSAGKTCPTNGATISANSSCSFSVTYTGSAQCGGSVIQRPATLNVTAGPSTASASLTAANFVYKVTDLPCR